MYQTVVMVVVEQVTVFATATLGFRDLPKQIIKGFIMRLNHCSKIVLDDHLKIMIEN